MTDLFSLASKMSDLGEAGGIPPVHLWKPDYCGEIDIKITKDGLWFHEGSPIGRPQLVRLFSTVLYKEREEYFLITPVEKMKISVEDAPFIVTDLQIEGEGTSEQKLIFTTNVGDQVVADKDHPIVFRNSIFSEDGPVPYIITRYGLEAKLSRPIYYQLAELAEGSPPIIRSEAQAFLFGIDEELSG